MTLHDRVAGVLLGQAVGDALGVPYEFGSAPLRGPAEMIGGGLGAFRPGEWSDDTQMAICIAEVTALGGPAWSPAALDAVAERFLAWYAAGPPDLGIQTARVLSQARQDTGGAADRVRRAAQALHAQTGRSAGNGALMRTAVVGVTSLDSPADTARGARALAELTHTDPLAGESCVLLSEAVRVAVHTGRPDPLVGLDLLSGERRALWEGHLEQAYRADPQSFVPNAFTVTALQAAVAAIHATGDRRPGREHLEAALQRAIAIGHDTDTVAAIAGGLLGAAYGASAIPPHWRDAVHGWPGARAERDHRAADLERLALQSAGLLPPTSGPR